MYYDNKVLLATGLFILVGIFGWNLFKAYEIRKDCSAQARYIPATGGTDGAFGKPSVGEHYEWGAQKFKTKDDAVGYCVKQTKEEGVD